MKILNIDSLVKKEPRELVIFGKSYEVKGLDVGGFLATTLAAEELANEKSLVKQVEATIDMIQRAVPTIERKELHKLDLEQLRNVVSFVRGDEVEGAKTTAKPEGAKTTAKPEGDQEKK